MRGTQWAQVHLFRQRLKFQYVIQTYFSYKMYHSWTRHSLQNEKIFVHSRDIVIQNWKKTLQNGRLLKFLCSKNRFTIYIREWYIWEGNRTNCIFFLLFSPKNDKNTFKTSVWEVVAHYGTFLTVLYGKNVWLTTYFCKR